MQEVIVDCASGAATVSALTPQQASALTQSRDQAATQGQALAAEQLFGQQQRAVLRAIADALHDQAAATDAAAVPGLVHKLLSAPAQPLSAPEMGTLVRFVLRCLLP